MWLGWSSTGNKDGTRIDDGITLLAALGNNSAPPSVSDSYQQEQLTTSRNYTGDSDKTDAGWGISRCHLEAGLSRQTQSNHMS